MRASFHTLAQPLYPNFVQLRGRHFVQALAQIGNKGEAEVLHLMVMTSDGQVDGQEDFWSPMARPMVKSKVSAACPKILKGSFRLQYPIVLFHIISYYFVLFQYLSRSQPDSHEKPSVDRLLSISSCMAVIQPAFLRYHTVEAKGVQRVSGCHVQFSSKKQMPPVTSLLLPQVN